MKILMCTLGYLPAVSWGGPVKFVYEVASELKRRGHEVSICASNRLDKSSCISEQTKTEIVGDFRVSYLKTYTVNNWRGTVGPTLLGFDAMRVLWNEIKSTDVVHANGTRNAIVLTAYVFCHLLKKPLILQPHGTLPQILSSVWLKKIFDGLFMEILLNNADAVIALQSSEYEQILSAGGDSSRILIVPVGKSVNNSSMEHQNTGAFRRRYHISDEKIVFLFLGRINPKKGVDLLVEAYAQFPDELKKVTQLVIAGPDDGHLEVVMELVDRYQLRDQVTFTGVLSARESEEGLLDSDIFVLSARKDTFPMAIVEACAFGLPMVVTDACEIADMLDGKAASIVPVNSREISKAMQELLLNADLRHSYSKGAKKLMEKEFSIRAVGDRLETIYKHVLGQKARGIPSV